MVPPEVRDFADVLPEPSLLLSLDGRVLHGNRAAARLFGSGRSDLVGSTLPELTVDQDEKLPRYLRLCARTKQLLPGSIQIRRALEPPLEVRCDGAALIAGGNGTPGLILLRCRPKAEATDHFVLLNQKIAALSKEIAERKKAELQRDELLRGERAARQEAERIGRMKDEFLATLSHELRTPLNAILGWTTLLQNEPLPPGAEEGVEVIARNARAQKQLIEDLLDLSRIISGKIRLDVQRVELAAVIEGAYAAIRPGAEAKNLRVQLTLDPLAGPIKGDPSRLQQVVWNLLANAVKFTPKGGRIQVFLERVNSHVDITVTDTGCGISPAFLPHVFERFQQADATSTRHHGGLGIGLSIAKQLVELHGGSIWAKSPGENQGATFVVRLPVVLLHEDDPAGAARVHPSSAADAGATQPAYDFDLSGLEVLVVDDEADARQLATKLLRLCQAEVRAAASTEEALALLDDKPAHIILSDIGMPVIDGYDFIRQVRARPPERGGRAPAIAVTAFARSEDRTRAMIAGYNLHLSKPVESKELIAAIGTLAGRTAIPRR